MYAHPLKSALAIGLISLAAMMFTPVAAKADGLVSDIRLLPTSLYHLLGSSLGDGRINKPVLDARRGVRRVRASGRRRVAHQVPAAGGGAGAPPSGDQCSSNAQCSAMHASEPHPELWVCLARRPPGRPFRTCAPIVVAGPSNR